MQPFNKQGRGFPRYFLRRATPFVILGVIYYIWLRMTHLYIPCVFRHITGYKCPGCGITTMCVNLLRFRFNEAFYANPFLFTTIPFILFEVVYNIFLGYKEKSMPLWNKVLLGLYCTGLIIFAVIRNIL